MLIITVVLAVVFVIYYKKKGTWHCRLGFWLFVCVGISATFFGSAFNEMTTDVAKPKILEYRQEKAVMKEKQDSLKKEFIQNKVLDDDSLDQFLNDYLELDNQILNSDKKIEEMEKDLKSKETAKLLLFFNLF